MQNRVFAALLALCTLQFACGDKVTVNPSAKGAEGESCTRRDDCAKDLSCLAGRCTATEEQGPDSDGGQIATGGKAGESCTWRGDCQPDLACMDQTCVEDTESLVGDSGMPVQRRGDRGETCTARNDCKENLACVAGRCREDEYDVSVQTKQCSRVECAADADCCKNFVAPNSCPTLKVECEAGTNMTACTSYAAICVCRKACKDQLCATSNKCMNSSECSAALVCVNEKCVQCSVEKPCSNPMAACVDGACKAACTRNEECPLFFNCQAGKCVYAGCSSDRECYFSTRDPLSKCTETKCQTPCESDAECSTVGFQVCDAGRCVDVGCESDAECRVRLNLNEQTNNAVTGVCRAPTK